MKLSLKSSNEEERSLWIPISGYSSVSYCCWGGKGRLAHTVTGSQMFVCACVCTTPHLLCCVKCSVNLWTDSSNSFSGEKSVIMANQTKPNRTNKAKHQITSFYQSACPDFHGWDKPYQHLGTRCPWKRRCVDHVRTVQPIKDVAKSQWICVFLELFMADLCSRNTVFVNRRLSESVRWTSLFVLPHYSSVCHLTSKRKQNT